MSTAAAASSAASVPPPASDMVHRDFPGWLPPMLVKELRQGLRTRGFVGMLVVFQVVMLVVMFGALSEQTTAAGAMRAATSSSTSGVFWTIMFVQLILLTPMRAIGGLQQEVDSRTLDLLMLTRLNAWGVVLGKWISLVAQTLLLVCTMLPYLVVRYFTDNADILGDLARCLAMVGVSAVLAAAGLWGSGLGKAMRIVLMIVMVWGLMALGGAFGSRMFGMGFAPVRGGGMSVLNSPIQIFDAALITAFFLVSAVRNIAPLAENHSLFIRSLPVLALLPVPFIALSGSNALANQQLLAGGLLLTLVLIFEFASTRIPMAVQWRHWRARGPRFAWFGRALLPGWQSAFVFGVVVAAGWALLALGLIGGVSSYGQTLHLAWLAPLLFTALLFPAVLRSYVPFRGSDLLFYFATLVLMAGLTLVGFWLAAPPLRFDLMKYLMQVVPVGSFLSALDPSPLSRNAPGDIAILLRSVVALLILILAWRQSRPYWRILAGYDARERMESPKS